jgi:hypothetical protein
MHFRTQVDEIKLKQNSGPGANVDYDSTDPSSTPPPGMGAVAGLVGTPVALVLSPAGKVVSVERTDAESGMVQTSAAPAGAQGLGGGAIEEMLKDSFEQGLAVYPPRPVAIGDTWKADLSGLSELPVEAEVLYKLRDRSNGRAYIDLSGSIEAEQTQNSPMGKIALTITADIEGELIMEEATGCILNSDAQIDMKVKMKAGGGLMGGGDSESMKMKVTMRQQLVEKGYTGASTSGQR